MNAYASFFSLTTMWKTIATALVILSNLTNEVLAQGLFLGARRYPSLRISIINATGWTAATDPQAAEELIRLYGSNTASSVMRWEADHVDLVDGGYYSPDLNATVATLAYMELQVLYGDSEIWSVRQFSKEQGLDYEDLFLHVAEDTRLNVKENKSSASHWRGGVSVAWGNDVNSFTNYNWQKPTPPWGITPLNGNNALYVGYAERFEEITVTLAAPAEGNGQFWIEYCDSVHPDGYPATWKTLPLLEDGTQGMTRSGRIRWIPPTDWKWMARRVPWERINQVYPIRIRMTGYTRYPTIDNIVYYSPNPATTGIRRSRVLSATGNTVRLEDKWIVYEANFYKDMVVRVVSGPGQGQQRTVVGSDRATLTVSPSWDVVPTSASEVEVEGPSLTIWGWDPANDRNGDGFVDDSEFANLVNPNARARFRWQSRLPIWLFTAGSVRYRANLWHPRIRDFWVWYVNWLRTNINVAGVRNDNLAMTLDWDTFPVISGGRLEANVGNITDSSVQDSYDVQLVQTLNEVRSRTGAPFGANVSIYILHRTAKGRRFLQAPGLNLTGTEDAMSTFDSLYRVASTYYHAVYAAYGKIVEGFFHHSSRVYSTFASSRDWWERSTMNGLAMHYLWNFPDRYIGTFWYWRFVYGSGLTDTVRFWKAGVPNNMAYIPVKALSIDIGRPAGFVPDGYEALAYRESITVGGVPQDWGYTPIGRSTDTRLFVGDYSPDGSGYIDVEPTHIFYLYKQGVGRTVRGVTWPADCVLARMYTNGIVLYRCPWIDAPGGFSSYVESPVVVSLPGGPYRQVNYDGTLGPPVNEIQIRGFEGMVLVKAATVDVPGIEVSIDVDKRNPKPLDVISVTVEVRNSKQESVSNIELRIPIGRLVYEQGSVSPSDLSVDTSVPSMLKVRIPHLTGGQVLHINLRLVVP